jgi:pSer/pThr/pTyr-binding forkhead associated (FHA) protein
VCSTCGHQFGNLDNRAGDHRAGDHRAGDHAAWQIVFADGRVERVDRTLVLGRDPHPDDDAARPVTLDCELVSATHLEVRAVGAELHLVDLGSRNNTFVLTTGDAQFVPIEPGRPHRVGDGAVVQLGSRRFTVVRIEGGADVGSKGTSLGNAPQ